MKKQNLLCFLVCFIAFMGAFPLTAQTIVNADFESGNSGFLTDYDYTSSGVVEAGHYCVDNTSNGHGGGQLGGWPTVLGYGGSGKYLLVNGYGGDINQTKVVWKQTVNVSLNTNYAFSCQVVNLAQSYFGYSPIPAVLRLKINGSTVGDDDYEVAGNNNWHEWTNEWFSGSATQAVIEIYDVCNGNSGIGDDFGLDHISMTQLATYSVTAVDDEASVCLNGTVQIDVLDNDIILPNSQGVTVQITQQPTHGIASVNQNTHKISYSFIETGYQGGIDQIKYKVTIPHGENDEAWVYINTSLPPNVGWIDNPGTICAGGPLGIPTPSVVPDQGTGQWEKCQNQSGNYVAFDPNNIPLSMNGWWVRFTATNDCGEGSSNSQQITVTNGPSITGQTPQIPAICAGGSLNLTPPTVNANGSTITNQGWVAAQTENGEYQSFNLSNISASYNGWFIRYMVESSCGFVYSNPARQLTVNVAPDVTGTLQAPPAICAGGDLELTVPSYTGNGTGAWEICQTQNGTYQSFSIQNVPATYNNWYLHYKVSNDCGNDVSNAVQIHVYDAPTIATPATPQAICAGGSFNLTTPTIQNNGSTVTNQGWQIAATQNGTYNAFNNNNVPYTYNGYWIRYFAENECGETNSASVQVTVNDEPVVGPITAPAGICAGESFSLTVPQVDWRHVNQGTGSWEIAPTSSGDFIALNNNNIPFLYNGYYIRYKAVNGCGTSYSTNVVQVVVYSTEPTYDTITACDTYIWNGVTCDHTANYQAQVQSPNGCNITAHLYFVLSDAYTETQTVSECDSYFWHGHTYTNSGTYGDTIFSGNPLICDSIFTLSLTINRGPEILENLVAPQSVCVGSALNVNAPLYEMNHSNGDAHWEYATSASGPFTAFDPTSNSLGYGTYYLRYAVINECDEAYSNVVPFHVDAAPEASMQLSGQQVCEGQSLDLPGISVNWNNEDPNDRVAQWQMASTQNGTYAQIDPTMPMQMSYNGYWLRFWAHNSCGDDIVGPVQVTVISAEDQWLETITACDSYTLESGETITESTTLDYEVFEPCYHFVHQPIEINHRNHVFVPITSCHDEYTWPENGVTYYRPNGMQWDSVTLINHYGCDSVRVLQLDFGDYAIITETPQQVCNSYFWPRNNTTYYYDENQPHVFDSIFIPGDEIVCDSMIYLNFTMGRTWELEGEPMTECSGFVWHGVSYYDDTILFDSLQTAVTHCDSIISYALTIIPPLSSEESIVSCHPIWWQEHYCEEEADYQHTFVSVQGCDSIVTMHFSLSAEIEQYVDTLACHTFNWYGHLIETDGQSSHTFLTPQGCDSTVYLNVTFIQADIQPESLSACDSYEFNGVLYDHPGVYQIYHDTVFAQNGCVESVQLLNLTINDSEQLGVISGGSYVYVASSLISGIYQYELDNTGVVGEVVWSISNPDWQIVESNGSYCRVFVGTPGTAILEAQFMTSSCGLVVRSFEITAGFFGVGEQALEVNVYPNPTKGTVTVEAEGIESIRLIDMMGQVLENRQCNRSDSLDLNLSGYAPSVYLLEIHTVYGTMKKRVTVCR